jgi:hypothetical protein
MHHLGVFSVGRLNFGCEQIAVLVFYLKNLAKSPASHFLLEGVVAIVDCVALFEHAFYLFHSCYLMN